MWRRGRSADEEAEAGAEAGAEAVAEAEEDKRSARSERTASACSRGGRTVPVLSTYSSATSKAHGRAELPQGGVGHTRRGIRFRLDDEDKFNSSTVIG